MVGQKSGQHTISESSLTKLTVPFGSSPRGRERLAVPQNFLHCSWPFRCETDHVRCRAVGSRLCATTLYELNEIVSYVPGIEKLQASFSCRFFGSAIEARGKSPRRERQPQLSKRAEEDAVRAHIVQQSDRAAGLHDAT